MAIKVGINGFGRIGRTVFRQLLQRENFQVVGINDLANLEDLAYLLKYDSVHGWFSKKVAAQENAIQVDQQTIPFFSNPDPKKIPWKDTGAEIIGFNKGGTVEARGVRVSMVAADHSGGDWSAGSSEPIYLGEPAGFVVELENGRRVYHAGDTALFGDMRLIGELHRPDVAFLPIGGHFTMDPPAAARAVELLGCATVVPIHYGTFPLLAGTPDQLREELEHLGLGDVAVLSPAPGEAVG